MNLGLSTEKKTILVTGANGAIGKAITRQIASKGYNTIMVCRDPQKAEDARSEIIKNTNNPNVHAMIADLSRHSEVKKLANQIDGPVFALVNNAATAPRQRMETPEGIEVQFAANVLNYFWMSLAFHNHLKKAPKSRIVNVASFWAGDLDLRDLQFKKRTYDNNIGYRQSKQANRMLTVAFAEKFNKDGILVNACHPGEVNSRLSNNLGFAGGQSPDQGAQTPVWLATAEYSATGKWFESMRERPCAFSQNREAIIKLYEICEKF